MQDTISKWLTAIYPMMELSVIPDMFTPPLPWIVNYLEHTRLIFGSCRLSLRDY